MKVKVDITKDELWPWYSLDNEEKYFSKYSRLLDVSEELFKRYTRANEAFFEMQLELEELYHEKD
jgi:hypothetical protein